MKVNVRNFHTLTILSSCHCQAPKLSFAKWLLTRQYKSGYRGYKTIHLDTHVQILPSTYYLVGRYPGILQFGFVGTWIPPLFSISEQWQGYNFKYGAKYALARFILVHIAIYTKATLILVLRLLLYVLNST